MVQLANGAEVKASNLHGVIRRGARYYYRMVHHQSFDPKSRGLSGTFVVLATLDGGTQWEVEIYRWKDGPIGESARQRMH